MSSVIVVSSQLPTDLQFRDDDTKTPVISDAAAKLDALDDFNHPRIRRGYILKAFSDSSERNVDFQTPSQSAVNSSQDLVTHYQATQSEGLLQFFTTAWQKWVALGKEGRDPMASKKATAAVPSHATNIPALVPGNFALPRFAPQFPSKNVMGQIGYYCTDICTPIFDSLLEELQQDAAVMEHALQLLLQSKSSSQVVYALPTHPGHHAATDSFGGYCYLNQAAHAASRLVGTYKKVAVLDIDYHCGNGTASIFYDNPNVLTVSIHCHPDYDYPFHSGFAEESDTAKAICHLPLLPHATWEKDYQSALEQAMQRILQHGTQALVLSLGLDFLQGDPVTLMRAGFDLQVEDCTKIGQLIGKQVVPSTMPILIVQEGGYKFPEIGTAAANVVLGVASQRQS